MFQDMSYNVHFNHRPSPGGIDVIVAITSLHDAEEFYNAGEEYFNPAKKIKEAA